MRRMIAAVVVAVGLAAAGLAGASGHDPAGTVDDPKLEKFRSPDVGGDATAEVSFKASPHGDAPGSPQPKALRLTTFEETGVSYAGVEVVNIATNGKALADVGRIAYKTRGYSGAGAPRVSLVLSNGHVAYLSSFYCNADLAPTNWRRTTFFGDNATCTIHTSTTSYTAGGGESAFDKLVAGEGGGVTIDQILLVQDEGPAVAWVDDLRFDGVQFSGPNVTTHSH